MALSNIDPYNLVSFAGNEWEIIRKEQNELCRTSIANSVSVIIDLVSSSDENGGTSNDQSPTESSSDDDFNTPQNERSRTLRPNRKISGFSDDKTGRISPKQTNRKLMVPLDGQPNHLN